ncbi:MAG: hypothetical protein FWH47_02440 [Methanomassiliicoccaceae archaeon]|nr:hypothetical protein [Methanomassiliicoccaceae archaeon]
MPDGEWMDIGRECLVGLDEVLTVLKRARSKSRFSMMYLDLVLDPLTNRDIKKAGRLAGNLRPAMESLKLSLEEEGMLSPNATEPHVCVAAIDQFLGLDWTPPLILVDISWGPINKDIDVVNNARSAITCLLEHARRVEGSVPDTSAT